MPKTDPYAEAGHFEPKKLYAKGKVPFFTLATFEKAHLRRKLLELVGNPSEYDALEIGPGEAPVIKSLDFKRKVFMDVSHEMAKNLPRPAVTARVEDLPVRQGKVFGAVVVNEVLTHVHPDDRARVVKEIAGKARHVLVLDRPFGVMERLAGWFHWLPLIPRDPTKVNEREVEKILEQRGFSVEKEYGYLDTVKSKIRYFILTAKHSVKRR